MLVNLGGVIIWAVTLACLLKSYLDITFQCQNNRFAYETFTETEKQS